MHVVAIEVDWSLSLGPPWTCKNKRAMYQTIMAMTCKPTKCIRLKHESCILTMAQFDLDIAILKSMLYNKVIIITNAQEEHDHLCSCGKFTSYQLNRFASSLAHYQASGW